MLKTIKEMLLNNKTGEKGASAVEYALIAGLIAVAIIAAVTLVGTDLTATFTKITDALN